MGVQAELLEASWADHHAGPGHTGVRVACMLSTGRIVSNGSCSLNAKLANETHCLIRRPRGGKILPTFSTHTPPTADHFARVSRTTHSTLKGLPLSLVVPELSEISSRKITIKCIFTEIFRILRTWKQLNQEQHQQQQEPPSGVTGHTVPVNTVIASTCILSPGRG